MNTTQDDGGPAFPQIVAFNPNGEAVTAGMYFAEGPGMSLRDWLIGMSIAPVIQTAIHQGVAIDFEEVAHNASRIADAVLAARKEAK